MTDLVEFLRARLDEREQCLRDDKANADKVLASGTCVVFLPDRVGSLSYEQELTEVTAKRRIIDAYVPPGVSPHVEPHTNENNPWDSCDLCVASWDRQHNSECVLRLLALPYADHPDYQEEWND